MIPRIGLPGKSADFHDSSLVDFIVNPTLEEIVVITSTPDESGIECLWRIRFYGVMRLEFETVGDGDNTTGTPVDISDIYIDTRSVESVRWAKRADQLEIADGIYHVVLASSFMRGWGAREDLEGISIFCRGWKVDTAPNNYRGREFSRPRIEGSDERRGRK